MERKTGIFYDGSHTFIGFEALLGKQIERLNFKTAEKKLNEFLTREMQMPLRFVYQGWYEGLMKNHFPNESVGELSRLMKYDDLKQIIFKYQRDRQLHWALIAAGIEPIWLQRHRIVNPVTQHVSYKEKGVDTALTISLLRKVELFNLETVIVFCNDKDYDPLFHNVRKNGATVITIDCTPVRKENHGLPRFADRSFHYSEIFNSSDLISDLH
jgi:hypothetical protein